MNTGVVIGLFTCFVVIVIVGAGFKQIERLKTNVYYLDIFYHSMDKRWGDMYDIIKKQQEEIKILKELIEQPEEKKKCCCGNCRFYYELNNKSSACLNVHVNNKHKGGSTLYAENKPITWGTIKCVEPGDYCEYYESEEGE